MDSDEDVARLLAELRSGDRGALERLFPLIYTDLRQRAHRQLAGSRPGDTLSTTALVHETYLKLTSSSSQSYVDRVHFFAVASRAMRQILVDYARQHSAEKRGGGAGALSVDRFELALPERASDVVALDEALGRLAQLDERLARVVELRFFAGLSVEETGAALDLSPRTIKREWQKARAWLYRDITSR